MAEVTFDYEKKIWGGGQVYPRPSYISGLKLAYGLEALREVTGSVCDVGCGAGSLARAIKRERPDLEVYGVDVAKSVIQRANEDPGGVIFKVSEAERLPFGDASLDAVVMFDVLEHVSDPAQVLGEIHRVLKPGGTFHLATPLEDQPWTLYRLLTRHGWRAKNICAGHIQFFSDRSYRELAAKAGLPVESVKWSFQPLFASVDVAFFTIRWLRGAPLSLSVEDYVSGGKGLVPSLVRLAKSMISAVGWYEAKWFAFLPAGTGHYNSRKA